jgi:hypothetical protein
MFRKAKNKMDRFMVAINNTMLEKLGPLLPVTTPPNPKTSPGDVQEFGKNETGFGNEPVCIEHRDRHQAKTF